MVRKEIDINDPTLMYGKAKTQHKGTLLPIAGSLYITCSVKILLQNGSVKNMIEEGRSSAPNVKKYINELYTGAMQNAMYKATDKIGKTGAITKIGKIYFQKIEYPNSVNVKIKRINRKNKYFTQIKVNNDIISTTKWSPLQKRHVEDFNPLKTSFDENFVSEETIQKREDEQNEFFNPYY